MLHQPYISYIRDAAGVVYRRAWVLVPDAKPLPFEHAFGSWLYYPDGANQTVDVGELPTDELVWSPYKTLPSRICPDCYVGDQDWFDGDWPSDAPPVDLAADGFAVDCDGGCMGCVKSVGLAADPMFDVTGTPVTVRGTISLDWKTVPAGYALTGPSSGPDAKPTFKPLPSASITINGDGNITATESSPGVWDLALVTVPYSLVTAGYPASDVGSGTLPSGVLLPAAQLDTGSIPSGVTMPADQLTAGTLGSGVLLPPSQLDTGSIASGATLGAAQLTAGTIPSGVDIPYSQVTGAPAALNSHAEAQTAFSYGTTPTNVFTFTATTSFVGNLTAENVSGSGGARLYFTVTGPRLGTQTNWVPIGGPGGWTGFMDLPRDIASSGITVETFTSITVAISGNGTPGVAKIHALLIGD